MTTYAPNYTPRYRARYVAAGIEHTIQVRGPRGSTGAEMTGLRLPLTGLFLTFADKLADDFTWIAADYALTDSDDFVATTIPEPVTGLVDAATFSLKQRCTSTNFNGRAVGSRASLYMYGILWATGLGEAEDNGRVTGAEDGDITTAAAICSDNFKANSGTTPIWHAYANIKLNDHLLKLLRRGTIS